MEAADNGWNWNRDLQPSGPQATATATAMPMPMINHPFGVSQAMVNYSGMPYSNPRCIRMQPPVPPCFQGDMEGQKDMPVPEFNSLTNFPSRSLPGNLGCCVMCGQTCPTSKTNNTEAAIIPSQNKGLCTHCDASVWIVASSGMQIKWCKGCKKFRCWAAFGDKGHAAKCTGCRDRAKELYAARKEKKLMNENGQSLPPMPSASAFTPNNNNHQNRAVATASTVMPPQGMSSTKYYHNNSPQLQSMQLPAVTPRTVDSHTFAGQPFSFSTHANPYAFAWPSTVPTNNGSNPGAFAWPSTVPTNNGSNPNAFAWPSTVPTNTNLDALVSNVYSPTATPTASSNETKPKMCTTSNTNSSVVDNANINSNMVDNPNITGNTNSNSMNCNQMEDPEAAPRRSGRERVSTTVTVDGYAIKKQNNYKVVGLSYQYGVAQDEPPAKQPSQPLKQQQQPKLPKAPPVLTEAEMARRKLRDAIASRKQAKQLSRQSFLKEHVAKLKPFLEPKVYERIQGYQVQQNLEHDDFVYTQPKAITATLRDYQLEGLNFMSSMYSKNIGFLLGDEMGLGKTLQTISLICHLKESFGVTGPSVIVCPLSVLESWCKEIKNWAPSLKYYRLHQSNTETMQLPDFGSLDCVVTTYEMCKASSLRNLWSRQHFNLVVLDEGHKIKGIDTLVSEGVRRIHAECRVILTGTPLANNLSELYALLNFLLPEEFTTVEPFAAAYDLNAKVKVVDEKKLTEVHKVLDLFMIRRLKSLVEKKMPPKIETKVICPLSNSQIWWYKSLLLKDLSLVTGEGTKKAGQLNNLIMQLRKCANHPYQFPFAEDIQHQATLEELVGESGKLAVLDMLLRSLYEKNHRVVIFSQFKQTLDILDDYCKMRGWRFCRFDGGTGRAERNFLVDSFNEPGSDRFIFLMSTRSGGMGINLQANCDTVVMFDSDWNPQCDLQAEARVHRIGQTKKVFVYRLVTGGTVEERILQRAEKKLFLSTKCVKDGQTKNGSVDDEQAEANKLLDVLKFGCNAVFGNSAGLDQALPTKEDIEMLTDRSRNESTTLGNIKGDQDNKVGDFDATQAFTSTTDFGGIDFKAIRSEYQKKRRPKDIGELCDTWRKKQKRERKSRITLVDAQGSGYGSAVPVLKANDYELATGERSVFQQELGGRGGNFKNVGSTQLKAGVDFENQDICQSCGDGGMLLCCPRCPVAVHPECAGCTEKNFMCCTHHHCYACKRGTADAGGFMYRCTCCPLAFCGDCLPDGARILDKCERMEDLGYTIKHGAWVHCSPICENVAKQEYGWVPPDKRTKAPCPQALELSKFFGGKIDDCVEAPEDLIVNTKRQRKKRELYGDFVTQNKENGAQNVTGSLAGGTGAILAKPSTVSTSRAFFAASSTTMKASAPSLSFSAAAITGRPAISSLVSSRPQALNAPLSKVASSNTKPVPVSSASHPIDLTGSGIPKPYKEEPATSEETTQTREQPVIQGNSPAHYEISLPVVDQSLNINISETVNNTSQQKICLFSGYRRDKNGNPYPAEQCQAFRNRLDRIIGVNGVQTETLSFEQVIQMIRDAILRGNKNIQFKMEEYGSWHTRLTGP